MKKVILLAMTILVFIGCKEKEQRYFSDSAEINSLKAGIKSYETGDWTTWKNQFADTAKVYVNSEKSISVDDRVNGLKEMSAAFSKYGFDHDNEFIEMVLDKDNETWVYYWAPHHATIAANNKQFSIPVHLAVHYDDGKIIEEHVLFDGTEMNKEMDALVNMSADEKTILNTINNITSAWNTNDKELMYANMVENMLRTANGASIAKNKSGYGDFMDIYHNAFPDFKVSLNTIKIVGNTAYLNWTCTGSNKGEFMGNPPANKKIETQGFSIWKFDAEGKATREDAFYDNLVVYEQLGYNMPTPK